MEIIKYPQEHRLFINGLIACSFMVVGLIILGGVTRLMGAGLSIVKWHPITGILPPLTEQGWQQEFSLYKQFPEYRQVNFDMTLAQFKSIYWIEYLHRLGGRLVGLALLVPTFVAIFKKPLRFFLIPLTGVWILGGLQGFMGWYMVKSGLIDQPWVSPYRLTAHFCLALIILALLLNMLFSFFRPLSSVKRLTQESILIPWVYVLLGLILATIFMGAFTAGLKAGSIYNTFPTMNGSWIPDDLLSLKPLWRNLFENPSTVQFCHRVLATGTWLTAMILAFVSISLPLQQLTRKALYRVGGLATLQLGLGITALLLQVPVIMGIAHQAVAVILLISALWLRFVISNTKCVSEIQRI